MERCFATFLLADLHLGVDVLLVNEVNRQTNFTPVARAPEYLRGLLNLRGQIVSVLDLGVKLGLGARTISPRSRCLVLKTAPEVTTLRDSGREIGDLTAQDPVGLLVDRIDDMVTIAAPLDPLPANLETCLADHAEGVVKLEDHLLVILRLQELLRM